MSGWNQVRPNHPMQMNQTPPVMGGGNMMMGNYGMNQSYQMSGGQMMYQQPYMQQAIYQQPMMNAYGNMAVNAQMSHHPMPPQAPLPSSAPDQPPPPAPSEPPPPNASAPLPPSDDKKFSSQPPPPPDSAKEWWKTEMENLTGSSRQELHSLTTTDWFLAMDANRQIEYWQRKMQLNTKHESSLHQTTQSSAASSQRHSTYGTAIQAKSSTNKSRNSTETQEASKQSDSIASNKDDQEVAPEWDKASGENPQEALKRYQDQLKKLHEQAAVFEKQYNDWRKQFDDWKDKHRNHPNKTQFNQYEKQWVTWQKQMLEQKKQNEANENRLLENVKKIKEAIEEEKKAKERALQMAFPGPPNVGNGQYQRPNVPGSQASDFPTSQYQNPAYNQNAWNSNNYRNDQYSAPGSYNPNMRPTGPQFDQSAPNRMQSGPEAFPGNQPHQPYPENEMSQWQRMSSNPQQMPFHQQRMPSTQHQVPPDQQRLPSNQERMPSNQERMPLNQQRMPSNQERMPLNQQRMPSNQERMPLNQQRMPSNQERMPLNQQRMPSNQERMPSNQQRMPSNQERMPLNQQRMPSNQERMPSNQQRMPSNQERMPFHQQRMPSTQHQMPSDKRRMPSNQQRMPSSQERMPLNQQRMQLNQQRMSSNQPRMTSNRPRMLGFNQERPLMDDSMNQNDKIENKPRMQQPKRNEYDQYGNLISSGSKFEEDSSQSGYGDNQQEYDAVERPIGNISQRPRYPGDESPRSQLSDNQPRPRFPRMGEQRARFPGDQQRPRFPGMGDQRPRFPGGNEQRGQLRGDQKQRPRFPGEQQQRQRFPNEMSKPSLSGDFSEEQPEEEDDYQEEEWSGPRFHGNQPRPRFPGNERQRQRLPADQTRIRGLRPRLPGDQQRPRFPGERMRFPGDQKQRPRLPGGPQQRPRFPGDNQQRSRFPGEVQQRPRIPGDESKRPRFFGDGQQRPRFPGDNQQRSRFPGEFQQRSRFPGDVQQRPRFQNRPSLLGDGKNIAAINNEDNADFADGDDYNEFTQESTNEPFQRQTSRQSKEEDTSMKDVFVDGEDLENYMKHHEDEKPDNPPQNLGPEEGPRIHGPRGPRFGGRGGPMRMQNPNDFKGGFDGNNRFPRPGGPPQRFRPRFPQRPPLRGPISPSGRFDNRNPQERFGNPSDFRQEDEDTWHGGEPSFADRPGNSKDDDSAHDDINFNAARKLAESNPLFSGDNLKKLQEQLKIITQNKKQEAQAHQGYDEASNKPMDSGNILEKAKNLSSLDLKNILSAVKMGNQSKAKREGDDRGYRMSSEERFRGGDQPRDVAGSSSFPDPLIDSLEELAALGALDNDAALQEYLRSDPMLEEELYLRAMHDKDLMMEARNYDSQREWNEDRPRDDLLRQSEERPPDYPDWHWDGDDARMSSSERQRGHKSSPRRDLPKRDEENWRRDENRSSDRPFRDRPFPDRPGDPMRRPPGSDEFDRRGPGPDGFDRRGPGLDGYDRREPRPDGFDRRGPGPSGFDRRGPGPGEFDRRGLGPDDFDRRGPGPEGLDRRGPGPGGLDRRGPGLEGYDERGPGPDGLERRGPGRDGFNKRGPGADGYEGRGPGPDEYDGRDQSPMRDLRDPGQRDLERQSIERRHRDLDRDLASVKERRETLDSVFVYDEREEERQERERSLERLRMRESDLRQREKEILAREQALREALRQYSPSRKRPMDEDRHRRDDNMRRGPPDDRETVRQAYPSFGEQDNWDRGRGSPGREFDRGRFHPDENFPRGQQFNERFERDRGRRSPSPKRGNMRRREMMDRNRDRPRRSPPRKQRRSRSPPRGARDEFGREHPRGRPPFNRGASPRTHEPSPRRFNPDKRSGDMPDPAKPPNKKPASPPSRPDVIIKPTGKPLTFADLQEPQEKLEATKPQGPLFVNIEDILNMPGRLKRPPKIVVILRGLPGCGKTHIAKMIRDKESTFKVSARVLGLDDYFMTEVEKSVKDPDTGKTTKKRVFEYEYEDDMEESYRGNLVRSFKKTLEDGYFTFVIMDAINDKVEYFSECYTTAKSLGFEVYIAEISADVHVCAKRNVHSRSLDDIQKLEKSWEKTPEYMNKLDLRQLQQDSSIQDVEMGDITDSDEEKEKTKKDDKSESLQSSQEVGVPKSKWETESAAAQLDKLDGIHKKTVKQSMEDFLSVTDDYQNRESAPGKKRVRWADINERKNQQRMRDVGFVVGQTDWSRMMDDSHATQALNRTKFI